MRALLLVAALGIVACDGPPVTSTEQAIINGSADPGDPAVVGLAYREVGCGSDITYIDCTGTLIAPRVVVTAAHCLGDNPPNIHQIFVGTTLGSDGTLVSVVGGRVHPDYDATTHANDIAALLLEADAPVAPVAMRTQALPDLTGATVRMVGYGITDLTSIVTGEKRAGTARVTAVGATEISMAPSPAMTCHGDSGGPVFADSGSGEELIGVTTYGDPACKDLGVAQRIDVHAGPGFLQPILDEAAALQPRRPFDPSEDFCATTCTTDADCPAETVCFEDHCSYRGLPAGMLGDTCTGNGTGCIGVPDGTCRMYTQCGATPPPPEGCCAVGGNGSGQVPIALALLVLRRRRR